MMKTHKLWLLGKDAVEEPGEVTDIDPNKATIIYFSGTGDFVETKPSFALRRSLVDIISSNAGVAPEDYNAYTISSREHGRTQEELVESILKFNKEPTTFMDEGKELYDLIMKKRVPAASPDKKEHKNNIRDIKQFFSSINFIGHSYGAVYLGQVKNALLHDMREKGYSNKDVENCTDCLLGCYIGPSRKLDGCTPMIPSLYAVSSHDPFPDKRGDYKELVKDDPHEFLAHKLFGNALVLYSRKSPALMPTLTIKSLTAQEERDTGSTIQNKIRLSQAELEEMDEEKRRRTIEKRYQPIASERRYRQVDGKWEPRIQWQMKKKERWVTDESGAGGHHSFRYTNITKLRDDLTSMIFQVEPFAHIVCDMIRTQIETSSFCIKTGEVRSGLQILNTIIEKELTTEGKDAAHQRVEDGKKMFKQLYYDAPESMITR